MRLGIIGATGKLGKAAIEAALKDERFIFASALTHSGSAHIGEDIGLMHFEKPLGILVESKPSAPLDVVIDFSCPEGTIFALSLGVPLVIGTTGHDETALLAIKEHAKKIPIVMSPNFSLSMNLLFTLLPQLQKQMKDPAISIHETHRLGKRDLPGGTAKFLAGLFPSEVPITSERIGDSKGEHEVTFNLGGETLTVKHIAHGRSPYALGALDAAAFVHDKSPGHYNLAPSNNVTPFNRQFC